MKQISMYDHENEAYGTNKQSPSYRLVVFHLFNEESSSAGLLFPPTRPTTAKVPHLPPGVTHTCDYGAIAGQQRGTNMVVTVRCVRLLSGLQSSVH